VLVYQFVACKFSDEESEMFKGTIRRFICGRGLTTGSSFLGSLAKESFDNVLRLVADVVFEDSDAARLDLDVSLEQE